MNDTEIPTARPASTMYTVASVAADLGITPGRVRQIARELRVGVIRGGARWLSDADVEAIRSRKDGRVREQRHDG